VSAAVLRTDGGSRGNPGPAGAGFVIEIGGEIVCRGGKFIPSATNNVAEYEAFIWGLENVAALGHRDVTVYADSELLVKQVNGQYRVKNEGLKPLFVRAIAALRAFTVHRVVHVRREFNAEADAMANAAMDACGTVGDAPVSPEAASGTLF
jgi:ribonuclease HI